MKTINQAFIAGWFHGRKYKTYQSVREVMNAHPSLSRELAEVYLNGQQDGINGDRFRLDANKLPKAA
jgi:hypothetical protein